MRAHTLTLPSLERVELVDVVANGEGRLVLKHDDAVILDEPLFPIVELGRDLARWLGTSRRESYRFDSMSFEEPGSIRVSQVDSGWVICSDLADPDGIVPETWNSVRLSIEQFVNEVAGKLEEAGWDPTLVFNFPYATDF